MPCATSSQFDRCRRPVMPSATTADSRLSTPARKAMVRADGRSSPSLRRCNRGHTGHRQGAGYAAELRPDGLKRQVQDVDRHRGSDDGHQECRQLRSVASQAGDDREGQARDDDGRDIQALAGLPEGGPLLDELGGNLVDRKAEQVFDLTRENDHGDAGGEAGDDRFRDVLDPRPQPREAGDDQDQSGHQGCQDQPIVPVLLNDVEDDHDEGARWAADLEATASKRRNQEAGDHSGQQPLVGCRARGDCQCHGERQSDDCNSEACDDIAPQVGEAVSLTWHREELRHKEMPGRCLWTRARQSLGGINHRSVSALAILWDAAVGLGSRHRLRGPRRWALGESLRAQALILACSDLSASPQHSCEQSGGDSGILLR